MDHPPRIITLGTAGGPRWWSRSGGVRRQGIATAVEVEGAVYLVDCGRGATSQLAEADLEAQDLRGIFITHLHSDHTVDLVGLLLFCWMHGTARGRRGDVPVRVLGPGDRGQLPPLNANASDSVGPLFPEQPTAGTRDMVLSLLRAHSTDLTDRMIDALRPSPLDLIQPEDITIPTGCGFDPNSSWSPSMDPFVIYADELVTVSATLVEHPPMAPAFAFRFDAEGGSVTISGDTAPSDNLVRLAQGTDLLLHEAIDMDWAAGSYSDVAESTRVATIEHHRKAHSTPRQAGEVASAAGAARLALHHLVPGHADPSVWGRAAETFTGPVLVPDDLESVSFARSDSATPMSARTQRR